MKTAAVLLCLCIGLVVVIAEIISMISRMIVYLEHLQLQLNMLSLGRLAPSTITPRNLQKLLLEIEDHIQPPLKLTGDPNRNLWNFYQYLTCTTILENDKILVVVPVPLLDSREEFEVFQVHNLPLPSIGTSNLGLPMTATYEIESKAVAINKQRTKFVLLEQDEFEACSEPLIGFCAVRSPLYPMYASKFCIMALFKNDSKAIKQQCQTKVQLNTALPRAEYLSDGMWVVSTATPITFSVLCHGKSVSSLVAQPPMSVLTLGMTCIGSSDSISLTPYYQQENVFAVNESYLSWLTDYALSNISLWKPVNQLLPKLDPVKLPKQLGDLQEINMGPLISRLQGLQTITKEKSRWPIWVYVLIALTAAAIVAGIVLYVRSKLLGGKALLTGPITRFWESKQETLKPTVLQVVDQATGATDADRATASAPEGVTLMDNSRVKFYPSLGQ
ncbi:hypothetical protein BaRGS_00002740 [Batillaria attramentaria]|uniref:Glycoprotein n=1 Tax=Batillaria attramentaria TaxID=370345 RepID=A0ABD0M2W0_9CAEN